MVLFRDVTVHLDGLLLIPRKKRIIGSNCINHRWSTLQLQVQWRCTSTRIWAPQTFDWRCAAPFRCCSCCCSCCWCWTTSYLLPSLSKRSYCCQLTVSENDNEEGEQQQMFDDDEEEKGTLELIRCLSIVLFMLIKGCFFRLASRTSCS